MRRDDINIPDPPANDRPGDHWMCGRRGDQSPCSQGPDRRGSCPLADVCRPRRTWAGRRRQITWTLLAVVALGMLIASRRNYSSTFYQPGKLSTPHAQILAGTVTRARCAACHPGASTSPTSWFDPTGEGHQSISQTDRCLDCHHTTIDPSRAKLAHNLPQRVRERIRDQVRLASTRPASWHDSLPGPAVDQNNIECSACHREHRGKTASLVELSDAQCQTCHADRFGSFATSHPDWDRWPYGRGDAIAFNHRTHMNKHFPAASRDGTAISFDCRSCHRATEQGEVARSPGYESACQTCHDEALRLEAAQGFDLLALPTLPPEAARAAGNWPEAATGFADGQITPLLQLLLRGDEKFAKAVGDLPGRDFSRLDVDQPEQLAAATDIAVAHRQILAAITDRGHTSILQAPSRPVCRPRRCKHGSARCHHNWSARPTFAGSYRVMPTSVPQSMQWKQAFAKLTSMIRSA